MLAVIREPAIGAMVFTCRNKGGRNGEVNRVERKEMGEVGQAVLSVPLHHSVCPPWRGWR